MDTQQNIFNVCDILNKDKKPIACLRDLKSGEEVLASWSDKKFYNATVDFIGTAYKTVDAKKVTKDMKKKMQLLKDSTTFHHYLKQVSPPLHRITQIMWTTMSSSLQLPGQFTNLYQPSHLYLSSTAPACNCLATVPASSFPVATYASILPASTYPAAPPVCIHSVSNPTRSSLSQYPKHHQPHTALPTPSDLSQQQPVLADLDQQRQPPAPTVTAKESFLKMLYSPNTHQKPAVLGDHSQTSSSEHESSSSLSADTLIIEHDPIPECGEPCFSLPESTEDRSWKPCRACKAEVEQSVEEKAKLQDVLCGISKYILSLCCNCSFNIIPFFSHSFPKVPKCYSVHTSTVNNVNNVGNNQVSLR